MNKVILLMMCGFAACATQNLSPEEVEWRRHVDQQNWLLCQYVYKKSNAILRSDHVHIKGRRHTPQEVRSDLMKNNCRLVLRDYWIEY